MPQGQIPKKLSSLRLPFTNRMSQWISVTFMWLWVELPSCVTYLSRDPIVWVQTHFRDLQLWVLYEMGWLLAHLNLVWGFEEGSWALPCLHRVRPKDLAGPDAMRRDRSRPHFLVTAHTGVDRLAAALRLAGSRRAAAEPSGGSSRAHNTATTAHYRDPTQLLGQGSGCEDIGQKLQTTASAVPAV